MWQVWVVCRLIHRLPVNQHELSALWRAGNRTELFGRYSQNKRFHKQSVLVGYWKQRSYIRHYREINCYLNSVLFIWDKDETILFAIKWHPCGGEGGGGEVQWADCLIYFAESFLHRVKMRLTLMAFYFGTSWGNLRLWSTGIWKIHIFWSRLPSVGLGIEILEAASSRPLP